MRNDANPSFTETTAWDHLHVFLEDLIGLFGKPIALARRLDFPQAEHKVCAAWLRALEAWLRRLLLIAAARVTPPPEREAKQRGPRKCVATSASVAREDSADWRVSFRLTDNKRARSARRTSKRLPRRFWDPIPLALRFEALLRVAQNPERHIQRAARLLAKNTALPNQLFRQKLQNMNSLRPYVAQCSFLVLETFPEAWRPADTS
jgi:hypothetical protein